MKDKTLDARGLKCPLPILRTNKALREIPIGGVLEVLTTDPISVADFQDFARVTGNELVEFSTEADAYRFVFKRLS